ncbi:regulator of G protein signaling superfamily [Pseudovirgaria hyperparasitica]|uniref:Regulator of G protein signaling superfamily n=1 Tax=Pseudovirgaria hyperparasitica TaxID=470096 RepID=A0A6A6W6U5_9PEZI|nr:regulator of G protein signaling superfamily [Pseudovirgaria hyperparasitica]KAF2758582.1 regulator of G protein signaling superfamily [Pseudovirgaria hyperparasitica]
MSTPTPEPDMSRNRLPTLFEVLSRRTAAPVDLFSFYIFMRDQQRSVDYLDFWLDVSQHLSLCRHYVRTLHRSIIDQTPDKIGSRRSSQVLEDVGLAGPSGDKGEKDYKRTPEQRLSAFLRENNEGSSVRKHSPATSQDTTGTSRSERRRHSFMTSADGSPFHDSSPEQGGSQISRSDIRASAEKILYTYLLPGSEREIILPQSILNDVTDAIEGPDQRSDPELFDSARDYVFQAMERDAFPGFLRAKALGNIVPSSMFFRVIFGLVCMFAGFWTAFILIFLNYHHATRAWIIIPFSLGVYMLFTHQYTLDPILVFAGYSEYTLMSFSKIKEPFVKKLLLKRSYMVFAEVVLVTAAICCLFIFVPGKRL